MIAKIKECSFILQTLQDLNSLLEQDEKDRKTWLPKFREEENVIAETKEEIAHTTTNTTLSSDNKENIIHESELKSNTIPPPVESTFCDDDQTKAPTNNSAMSTNTNSNSGEILVPSPQLPPPPPPPPMPVDCIVNPMLKSPSQPNGPIKIQAAKKTTEFFQEIFSEYPPEDFPVPEISSQGKSPKIIRLDTEKDAEQQHANVLQGIVEVVLQKQIGLNAQTIFKAIKMFRFEDLTNEAIETLLENSRTVQGTGTINKNETMTYLNVLDCIEDGREVLQSMQFFKNFHSKIEILKNLYSQIKKICVWLVKSSKNPKFRQLMSNITSFVGKVNEDDGYTTNGFKIETLPFFWERKPFGGKSALNILVGNLIQINSETLSFYEAFEYLDRFQCPDPLEIKQNSKELRTNLEKVNKVVEKLLKGETDGNFAAILERISDMENNINVLEKEWNSVVDAYNCTAVAFGQTETGNEQDKLSLIEILQKFVKEFKMEKHKIETENRNTATAIHKTLPKGKSAIEKDKTVKDASTLIPVTPNSSKSSPSTPKSSSSTPRSSPSTPKWSFSSLNAVMNDDKQTDLQSIRMSPSSPHKSRRERRKRLQIPENNRERN